MGKKSHKKVKRRQLPCTVAVEISRDELVMVIVEPKPDESREVRGYRVCWRHESTGLDSDGGMAELAQALEALAVKEKLIGGSVHVSLSSDFCVTRVLAGETDRMMADLRGQRERSANYLSLGAGVKVVSESIRALDVKNSQAWLTVTNRETLERVVAAMESAGLFPELVEHSIVAMCRAVGRMGGDLAGPVIIIEPNEKGVELGVSYRGQLLFDYRPGGIHSKAHVAEIVERHLERIQRYSKRYFRFASGQITRVFLVGAQEDTEAVRAQFANSTRLSAEVLVPAALCSEWQCGENLKSDPDFVAAMGSALIDGARLALPPNERGFPDLMDAYRNSHREPLWPGVRRHLWPVAAAAVVGLLVYGTATVTHGRARSTEAEVAVAEEETSKASTMKLELETLTTRARYLAVMERDLANLPIHELIATIVRAKPKDVYMDSIELDESGQASFKGKAESENLAFEFLDELKKSPVLQGAQLDSTGPDRLLDKPATWFLIKCKFVGKADNSEGKVKK